MNFGRFGKLEKWTANTVSFLNNCHTVNNTI